MAAWAKWTTASGRPERSRRGGGFRRARGGVSDWASADGLYGNDPVFFRALEADGETFVVDVHSNQHIWSEDAKPVAPEPHADKRRSTRATAIGKNVKVSDWIAQQPAEKWTSFKSGAKASTDHCEASFYTSESGCGRAMRKTPATGISSRGVPPKARTKSNTS